MSWHHWKFNARVFGKPHATFQYILFYSSKSKFCQWKGKNYAVWLALFLQTAPSMRLWSALMLKSNNSERYSEGVLMYRSSFSDFLKFMHNILFPHQISDESLFQWKLNLIIKIKAVSFYDTAFLFWCEKNHSKGALTSQYVAPVCFWSKYFSFYFLEELAHCSHKND